MTGPFEGVTVVEVGRFVSVPFCAQLLADGGARVIKVEPITGDPYRSAYPITTGESRQFLIKNRGKESLPLDFASPEGREVLESLVGQADVVLANLSPSAAKRNGLDYDAIRRVKPDIIYGTVTGFGRRGPDAALAGMDVVAQARSGLLTALGAERDGVPHHSEVQAADYAASMLLFGGIASALYVRQKTGEGQEVAVSLLGGALTLQNNMLFHLEDHDGWRKEFVDEHLPRLREAGSSGQEVAAVRMAERPDPPVHTAHYRAFAASDGHVAVGAGSPATRAALLRELTGGSEGALEELPFEELFMRRTVAEWQDALQAAGVPVARVRHVDEMPFDDHVLTEELVVSIEHPDLGTARVLGTPIQMSGTPFKVERPSPSFGAHTRSILAELGVDPERAQDLISRRVVSDRFPGSDEEEELDDAVRAERVAAE